MRIAAQLSNEEERCLAHLYAIAESQQARLRHFMNIYDLVLYGLLRGFERDDSPWIFRGQYDERFDLVPSFYRTRAELLRSESDAVVDHATRSLRSLEQGQKYEAPFALDANILAAWRVERCRKLESLRMQPTFPLVEPLSEFEQDAVIQHYLSGSPFLDFTKSICVAAFFATRRPIPMKDRPPTKGVIYVVTPSDLQRQLALGHVVTVELPECFERPCRQKALFVLTGWPELLRDRSLVEIWTFHHTQAGQNFECEEYGVSSSLLLPDPTGAPQQ